MGLEFVLESYLRILFGWGMIFLFLLGWGLLLKYLLRFIGITLPKNIANIVIYGFCIVILNLSIYQIFFPLDNTALIIFLLPVLVSSIVCVNFLIKSLKKLHLKKSPILKISLFTVSCILILAFIDRTLSSNFTYDMGLYYLQNTMWLETYNLIPGLANLSSRFGFNNSIFLITGLFDNFNLFKIDFGWISSAFFTMFTIFSFFNLYKFLRGEKTVKNLYFGLLWIASITQSIYSGGEYFVSMAPDSFVLMIELLIPGFILGMAESGGLKFKQNFFMGCVLAVTLYTIKLSGAVFGISSIILMVVLLLGRVKLKEVLSDRLVISTIIVSSLLFFVIITRSFLTSGYFFYPSTFLDLNPIWTVGKDIAKNEMCWVMSWARMPRLECQNVLSNNEWMRPWALSIYHNTYYFSFVFLVIVTTLSNMRLEILKRKEYIGVIIVSILSILYWFVSAPDFRFVIGVLWVIILFNLAILLKSNAKNAIIMPILALACIPLVIVKSSWRILSNDQTINISVDNVRTESRKIGQLDGIDVVEKVVGDQCWDEDLICVIKYNPSIRLINEKEGIKGGITLR